MIQRYILYLLRMTYLGAPYLVVLIGPACERTLIGRTAHHREATGDLLTSWHILVIVSLLYSDNFVCLYIHHCTVITNHAAISKGSYTVEYHPPSCVYSLLAVVIVELSIVCRWAFRLSGVRFGRCVLVAPHSLLLFTRTSGVPAWRYVFEFRQAA